MEKIVILSNQEKSEDTLIALLEAIFPECEICNLSPDATAREKVAGVSRPGIVPYEEYTKRGDRPKP